MQLDLRANQLVEESSVEHTQPVTTQLESECEGCRRNCDEEAEKFGLDSTFVSNIEDFAQSQYPWDEDDDLEMQEYQDFQTFYFGSDSKNGGRSLNDFEDEEMKEGELRMLRHE